MKHLAWNMVALFAAFGAGKLAAAGELPVAVVIIMAAGCILGRNASLADDGEFYNNAGMQPRN